MPMVNILPIINQWLSENFKNGKLDVSRKELTAWVIIEVNLRGLNCLENGKKVSLIVDCLIAAGIGREAEQNATVYGGYSCGD